MYPLLFCNWHCPDVLRIFNGPLLSTPNVLLCLQVSSSLPIPMKLQAAATVVFKNQGLDVFIYLRETEIRYKNVMTPNLWVKAKFLSMWHNSLFQGHMIRTIPISDKILTGQRKNETLGLLYLCVYPFQLSDKFVSCPFLKRTVHYFDTVFFGSIQRFAVTSQKTPLINTCQVQGSCKHPGHQWGWAIWDNANSCYSSHKWCKGKWPQSVENSSSRECTRCQRRYFVRNWKTP